MYQTTQSDAAPRLMRSQSLQAEFEGGFNEDFEEQCERLKQEVKHGVSPAPYV